MIDGRTTPTRPFADRHAQDRRVLLPGERPPASALAWWTAIVFGAGIMCGLALAECASQPAWAAEVASNPPAG